MRPWSRLLSKRRLQLPTIKEGSEEMARDTSQVNGLPLPAHDQTLSSQDYLLSIRHLAHPTFPVQQSHGDAAGHLDALRPRLRAARLGRSAYKPVEALQTEEGLDASVRHGVRTDLSGRHGNSDPLEYLYGHRSSPAPVSNRLAGGESGTVADGRLAEKRCRDIQEGQPRSRANSVPHGSSPNLQCRRKSSCPELHAAVPAGGGPASGGPDGGGPDGGPSPRPRRVTDGFEEGGGGAEETDLDGDGAKHSLISQWFSDCRSAWREARVRACMLPAIAEI